jgi:hypothetical protein
MLDLTDRYEFLAAAILFEGSLIGMAGLMGWWFDAWPLEQFVWDAVGFGCGLAAAMPMFALFVLGHRYPVGQLRAIRDILAELLGPSLAACRWYDLLLVAAVAGISEELLFRGVLHPLVGLAWSNVIFGAAHFVSPLYALLAGLAGAYLGLVLDSTGNLLAPIVTHALYDFLAFLVVAREYRARRAGR